MREVECSREASNYVMDSWPYTRPVLAALIAVRTSDPLPGEEIETGTYRGYVIVYERKRQNLRVLVIKPDENL
jgi:hypothetical protein